MGRTVIRRRGPVLVDRHRRGHMETIGSISLEGVARLVLDAHEVELAGAKAFGAEEGDGVCHGATVDGVAVGVGEVRRHSLDDLVGGRHVPMAALEVRWREIRCLPTVHQPGVRLVHGRVQDPARLAARGERPTLLDADRLQRVDHRPVPGQPRLGLHDAVQRIEIAGVVGDGRVEQDVDRVDEGGFRWVSRRRKRIDPNAFPVSDRIGDAGVVGAAIVGPQQGEGLVGRRVQRDVAVGHAAEWSGGRTRYLPPFPLSTPAGPTSSIAVCQQSSTEPTIVPVSAGGISSTTGPTSLVLKTGMK